MMERVPRFSAMAASAAFGLLSEAGRYVRALAALGEASWRAAPPEALARWSQAPRGLLMSALGGPLSGAAGSIAMGMVGFPEEEQLSLADELASRGAFSGKWARIHAKRWGAMLRCGAARMGFARKLVERGHLDARAMAELGCERAMSLAVGCARRGGMVGSPLAMAQLRFLAQAARWHPQAAREAMAKGWAASGLPPSSFDELWSSRAERALLRSAAKGGRPGAVSRRL